MVFIPDEGRNIGSSKKVKGTLQGFVSLL